MENKMKTKLILLAFVSITIASCKKDAIQSAQPQSPTISMNEQVADLIKRADKNLYEEVYGHNSERDIVPGKDYIPGYFRIPGQGEPGAGNVDDGYCAPVNAVCIAIVSAGLSNALPGSNLNSNVNLQFSAADNARLIINSPQPVVQSIKELRTSSNSNGGINVSFN